MYENGFGVPQAYDVAADLYQRAAVQGDAFAQSRLGLSYDKGHGVPQDVVLSYKWLDLAAAHAPKRERDVYLQASQCGGIENVVRSDRRRPAACLDLGTGTLVTTTSEPSRIQAAGSSLPIADFGC